VRLTWHKRYITLGPISTVISLAFRLRDPERLLGGAAEPGITCALVPSRLPGIEIGHRHDPMGIPFQNGPTSGRDVFVPVDFINIAYSSQVVRRSSRCSSIERRHLRKLSAPAGRGLT
jgi:acyl-CoA dehydrogenase